MYDEVAIWLNNALRQEIPEETAAFCGKMKQEIWL